MASITVDNAARPRPLRELLRDVWRARDLVWVLARQQFATRYRREVFGVLWAVLVPLAQALVLALVFTYLRAARAGGRPSPVFDTGDVSYPVFIFVGITVWTFFLNSITAGASSIISKSGMTTKVYFPRIVLPAVEVLNAGFGYIIALGTALAMAFVLQDVDVRSLALLPAAIALATVLSFAVAAVLGALSVYYRDIRYVLGAITRAWFFLTPVIYPLSYARGVLRYVTLANPVTGPVELAHVAIFGGEFPTSAVWSTCAWTVGFMVVALIFYHRRDRLLADPL